jgi:hypothetical protein
VSRMPQLEEIINGSSSALMTARRIFDDRKV